MNSIKRGWKVISVASVMLAAANAAALPPQAQGVVTRSETVRYERSQVATPEGATQVYQRLRAAAERVCADPAGGAGKLQPVADPGRIPCMRDALGQAVRQIGSPEVALLHADRAQATAKMARPAGEGKLARAGR